MADVFISYSRKDKAFVQRLDDALKEARREAWVDWEGIRPTEEFMQAIYSAIDGAHTFVFVLSPDSVASVICAQEVAHAATQNKRMIPLVARDVDAAKVPEALGKLNWIFTREADDFAAAIGTLLSALDTDLDWVHAHTRLLTRALDWEAKGKDGSFVLRGVDLRAAEQWLTSAGTDKERQPTALQTAYIIASRRAAAQRQRYLLAGVSLALIATIVLALVAIRQRSRAQANEAQTKKTFSRSDFFRADELIAGGKHQEALAYLARAIRTDPNNYAAGRRIVFLLEQNPWFVPQSAGEPDRKIWRGDLTAKDPVLNEDVIQKLKNSLLRRVDPSQQDSRFQTEADFDEAIRNKLFSPDKTKVKVGTRIYDFPTGQLATVAISYGSLLIPWLSKDGALFCPDGSRVVTFGGLHYYPYPYKGDIIISMAYGGEPIKLALEEMVDGAAFSPDARYLVTEILGGTTHLWGVDGGRVATFPTDDRISFVPPTGEDSAPLKKKIRETKVGTFGDIGFSADGLYLKMGGRWWARRTREPAVKVPLEDPFDSSDLTDPNPDDDKKTVDASVSTHAVGALGEYLQNCQRNDLKVKQVVSPDGARILTTSFDQSIRLWDAKTGNALMEPIRRFTNLGVKVYFEPAGTYFVTQGAGLYEGTIVWDTETGRALSEPFLAGRANSAGLHSWIGKNSGSLYLGLEAKGRPGRIGYTSLNVPPSNRPVPGWLVEVAEALGGYHLSEKNTLETLDADQRNDSLRTVISRDLPASETDPWVVTGHWLLDQGENAAISPGSHLTVNEFVSKRLAENTPSALEFATLVRTDDPALFQQLGEAYRKQGDAPNLAALNLQRAYALKSSGNDAPATDSAPSGINP